MTVFTATWRDEIGCEYRKDLNVHDHSNLWEAALRAAMNYQVNYLDDIVKDAHPRLIALEKTVA